jgi:predicted CXXCH cytochrome family protein
MLSRTRRGTIALLVAGAAILAGAATVLADGGPHQADINNGTTMLTADSCAGCHRAHTAVGENLINAEDEVSMCLVCHGPAAAGATTNVIDGVLAGTSRGLRGGGFTNAIMNTAWTSAAVSRPSTSAHSFDDTTAGTMWGNGAIGSGPGKVAVTLACGDCHNPHGNGAYRILRPIPDGSGALSPIVVDDQTNPIYTVASAQNRYFGEEYADSSYQTLSSLDAWCAQCHSRYDATQPGSASTSSGDPIFAYRHTTRVTTGAIDCLVCHATTNGGDAHNPYGITPAIAHEPLCQTCHVAHGSAAQMGTFSGHVEWPDDATTPSGNGRSSLLRVDNRGLCVACHNPTD